MRRILAVAALIASAANAHAQSGDSLRLPALRAAALASDPRQAQLALQAAQSTLRMRDLDAERLPALSIDAQAQYQSDVAHVPLSLPGVRFPTPARDTYDARLGARLTLLDPTLAPRRDVERASLAESQAQVRVATYALAQETTEAFFTAALLQARAAEVDAAIAGLDARLREAAIRVRGGVSLPSDSAAVAAALLLRRQDALALGADRRAALARLGELGHVAVRADSLVALALPDSASLAADVARARAAIETLRSRPEFAQLDAIRARIARQSGVEAARERPRVSAFARAGYGRPGLNPLATDFTPYWLGGVQLTWTPWTWGSSARAREVLAMQQRIVETNETALGEQLRRAVESDLATVDRLGATMSLDDAIVALRERIARETRARAGEGVATGAELVDRQSELLAARLSRVEHRVALAQASARVLTTLGMEVR